MPKNALSPSVLRTTLARQIGWLSKWGVPVMAISVSRNNLRKLRSDPQCPEAPNVALFDDQAPQKGVVLADTLVVADAGLADKDLDGTIPMRVAALRGHHDRAVFDNEPSSHLGILPPEPPDKAA